MTRGKETTLDMSKRQQKSDDLSAAAAAMGRRGGQSRSDAKRRAAKENLKKAAGLGGWPKGRPRKPKPASG